MTMDVAGLDAVYYIVKDLDKETEFYTSLLGAAPAMNVPGSVSEWTFADGNSFGLYESATVGDSRSGSAMFAVADVAAAVAEGKKLGITFHEGGAVTDTPACHMAFGEDPEGNQFVLHKRK